MSRLADRERLRGLLRADMLTDAVGVLVEGEPWTVLPELGEAWPTSEVISASRWVREERDREEQARLRGVERERSGVYLEPGTRRLHFPDGSVIDEMEIHLSPHRHVRLSNHWVYGKGSGRYYCPPNIDAMKYHAERDARGGR